MMPSGDTDDHDGDIIPHLLESLFKFKSDSEKLAIIRKGRPIPKLHIVKRDNLKNCCRTFQESWYGAHVWLCGSSQLNKLFCWPCLLMRPESSTWCSTGIDDLKRLSTNTSKHLTCKSHHKAVAEYDDILVSYGLHPEYSKDSTINYACKTEESTARSESEDDLFDQYFIDETTKSKKKSNEKSIDGVKMETKSRISFKAWREMNNGAVTSEHVRDSHNLYKIKRKIAKQDLFNSRLNGRKLKFEIELLKAKLDYQNALNAELNIHKSDNANLQKPCKEDEEQTMA